MFEKFCNALQCLAVGDAVGYRWEFIAARPERNIILSFSSSNPSISDDTQMTLFTFQAVMAILEGKDPEESFTESYLNWYRTQIKNTDYQVGLNRHKKLYRLAAPGVTCMTSLGNIAEGRSIKNDSYGCGSVMRLLPLVLLLEKFGLEETIRIAKISGQVTHHHQKSDGAIEKLILVYNHCINEGKLPEVEIGNDFTGWAADTCVDAAIRAVRESKTFDDLLVWCIQNTEDCDSTTAVAGSIFGLLGGKTHYKIYEQDILEEVMLTFKEYLEEAKQVGILYHFTKLQNLRHMMSAEAQKKDLDGGIFSLYGKRGVSFSRNYDVMPFSDFGSNKGYKVRLAIDGDKLSNRNKILPVLGLNYNQNDINSVLDVKNNSRVSRHSGEAEELVIPRNDIVDIKDCILSIDFLAYEEAREYHEAVKDLGFRSTISRKWLPYKKI